MRSKPDQGCTFVLRIRRAAEEGTIAVPAKNADTEAAAAAPEQLIGEGAHA